MILLRLDIRYDNLTIHDPERRIVCHFRLGFGRPLHAVEDSGSVYSKLQMLHVEASRFSFCSCRGFNTRGSLIVAASRLQLHTAKRHARERVHDNRRGRIGHMASRTHRQKGDPFAHPLRVCVMARSEAYVA